MMKQWSHQDNSLNANATTGKRSADGINTGVNDVEDACAEIPDIGNSPVLRKRADLKSTPSKQPLTRISDASSVPIPQDATPVSHQSPGAYTQSPRPWTPDSVDTVYPDNPNHSLHNGSDEPSDNEHENDTLMPSPKVSPCYRKNQSDKFEDDDITPTQLEDIYMQHDESIRVTDSSYVPVDPRTETG
jgi:hypothetical protein